MNCRNLDAHLRMILTKWSTERLRNMPEIETDNEAKRIFGAVMATLTPRQLTIPANRNATADYNANQVDLTRYNEDDADSIQKLK
jgi:hypothetical protein